MARTNLEISVIVLTKNEERNIAQCLDSLHDFGEVFVVDSNSTDSTRAITESMGRAVVPFRWNGEYPKKKQWSLDNVPAKHDWILCLDADERVSPELLSELSGLETQLAGKDFAAYDLVLEYRFAGRFLKHGHRVTKRALVDRTKCRFPEIDDLMVAGMEVEGHYQPQTHGAVGVLRERLQHDDRDPASAWFSRHNRYSDWEAVAAERRDRASVSARSRKGQLFARAPLKPQLFFLYSYLLRLGFLDGRAGFDYAWALSNYYWQVGLKRRELRRATMGASEGLEP